MTIKAHFDGKVFVPDENVNLPVGTKAMVDLLPPPRNPRSAREIAESLRNDTELHEIWNSIAAGRDSVDVVNDLRRQAAERRTKHDSH